VVTGTALSGEVNVGDTLWLTGVDKPMRVRGLHAQNQAVGQAWAGQRIALNIVGDAQKEALNRGDWLLSVQPPEASERVIVELQCHTPLTQWQSLHIHHAASHITGRVSLLEGISPNWYSILRCGWQITTAWCCAISPLALPWRVPVVTLNPPRRGKRKPEYLQWLAALAASQG
jgi:selenocysteine-specific elongation factor